MAKIYTLAWTPDSHATSQTVRYRVRNSSTWLVTPDITPANPFSATANSATLSGLTVNSVYQFEVLSNCCPGVEGISAIKEGIIFDQQTVQSTILTGVITVNQAVMSTVDTIDYKLYNVSQVNLQTIQATGANPQASFTTVGSGTYTVKYRYNATVNAGTVSSSDADQYNAWYVTGNIVVP